MSDRDKLLTGDGASADDQAFLNFPWNEGNVPGAASQITSVVSLGQLFCGQAAPCGTVDVDVKPAPLPAILMLLGLGLARLGVRREA
ncbi:MAG: hypothetical protein ACI9JM_001447 [Halioglobus sp.]|jgi:hypothetical protein